MLELTEKEWIEIYYAVETKINRIKIQHTGNIERKEADKWIADLTVIKNKLEKFFAEENTDY